MSELRKHYFLNHWVLISEKRGKRPDLNKKKGTKTSNKEIDKKCFFCIGNEKLSSKETFRLGTKKWIIRVVKNKFPAVENKKSGKTKTENGVYTHKTAYGYHEVIIDSNKHNKELYEYPKEHIKKLLYVFIQRINSLSKDKKISYVTIFKNYRKEAGTSIPHSHCQLIAYNHFPEKIKEDIKAFNKYKSCIYCRILRLESKSPRLCYNNKTFIAFTPYASFYPFEIFLMPKRHVSKITELNNQELDDLADQLKKSLTKLAKINEPYNLYLHNLPSSKKSHFHVTIAPRSNIMGGFELETGTIINTVLPEKAAKFYRK